MTNPVENIMNNSSIIAPSEDGLTHTEFLADVIQGLSRTPKTLPCKYFYDERGSLLFEDICETPEYYVTRVETAIYQEFSHAIAELIGEEALLIEPGAGSIKKVAYILRALKKPAGFVPMDISEEILAHSSKTLQDVFPELDITPMAVDFLDKAALKTIIEQLPQKPLVNKRVLFFPGSTIGNFNPDDAQLFLGQFANYLNPNDGLLIGVDLVKDSSRLEAAYNDSSGKTADFNKNLLLRINNELGGNFSTSNFEHKALFNRQHSRIEMHLISNQNQTVSIADHDFNFSTNETIHTENSYKYTKDAFIELANRAGYQSEQVWIDKQSLFSVHYLSVR